MNNIKKIKIIVLLLLFSFLSTACVKKAAPDKNAAVNKASEEKVLNIYNWEDYFGENTISDFEKQSGIKVNLLTFEDEEIMATEILSNPEKYDLVVGSGPLVHDLIEQKLLAKLDKNNIANMKNIGGPYIGRWYDKTNDYSIPYLWGTTLIAINTEFVPKESNSWSVLWDEKYRGKISMLNNRDEVIGSALKLLGFPLIPESGEQLVEAGRKLNEQKPLLRGYEDSMAIKEGLISGEIVAAQLYSGEGISAAEENEKIAYFIPKEGTSIWIDNFAIPAEAPHKRNAELFIDFILEPKVSAEISNYLRYASVNQEAKPYIDKEMLEDAAVYPNEEQLLKLEYLKLNNFIKDYNKIWADLRKQ